MNDGTVELESLVKALQQAWNSADAAAFAAHFAEDADFVHILGGHGAGRLGIERAHARLFETIYRGSSVSYAIEGQRIIDADTAILRLFQELEFGIGPARQTMQCRPTVVLQRQAGKWRILLMQNTRLAEAETVAAGLQSHPFVPERKAAS